MENIRTIYDEMTPFGLLRMVLVADRLVEMMFLQQDKEYPSHPVLSPMIQDYVLKKKAIKYPVTFEGGTQFQREVWNAMLTIPLGETRSYKDIAKQIGRPKALRAVGQACKRNPIGLVVPCHRVIGSGGEMRGYSGPAHIGLKQTLLNHERRP